jgi:hypothetical protein
MSTGFIWLRIGTSDRLLWTQYCETSIHHFWRDKNRAMNAGKQQLQKSSKYVRNVRKGQKEWKLYLFHIGLQDCVTNSYFNTCIQITVFQRNMQLCEPWGFCGSVVEDSVLPGYYIVSLGNEFRSTLSSEHWELSIHWCQLHMPENKSPKICIWQLFSQNRTLHVIEDYFQVKNILSIMHTNIVQT